MWAQRTPQQDGASWAVRHKFKVFGLQPGSKRPYPGSHGYLDAFGTGIEAEYHWVDHSTDNVGIVTGDASGIVVLDVEPGEPSPDGLIETLQVATARGGMHYYYRLPHGVAIKRRIRPLPGCDVLGDGGYVVGPGSVIVGAGVYSVCHDVPMAVCPLWIAKLDVQIRTDSRQFVAKSFRAKSPDDVPYINAGARNSTFASLAGVCRVRGLAVDEAVSWCLQVEANRCDRSGSWGGPREVERVVRGIYRRYG